MARWLIGAVAALAIIGASSIEARANPIRGSGVEGSLPGASVPSEAERNKELVRALFDIIYGTSLEDIARIDDLVAEDYIQHNPSVGKGREGLRQLLRRIVPEPKALSREGTLSVNLIAEGDFVVRQEMRTDGMLVDIFRVEDGRLQEHWDAFRFAPGAKRIPGF